MDTKTNKDSKTAKKLATGALVIATAIGASAAVDNPASYEEMTQQAAIVQDIGDFNLDMVTDEATADDEQKQKRKITVGSVIMAPIYLAGMGILKLVEFLLAGLSVPILGTLIRWFLFTCVVLGTLAIGLKVAFPDIPLRKLMSPKRIGTVVIGTAAVSIICAVLPAFGEDAATWADWIRLICGALIVAPMAFVIFKFKNRKRTA
ncbi:MAG: hypothetical protein KBS68_05240 [Clostridiales bacterium]|nr:hypothetical protein [Candidatus Crickella merdequi]